jgi:glyoxylase-like metal-dependent hydrolase (beta-lactamase superfamily II)
VGDSLLETRVGDRVRVWTLGGERLESSYGANCTGIAGRDAVLLVDPLIAPSHARLVEEAVRAWTDRPVRFVVLTHHHTDHALGASFFASRGAEVVAHRACRAAMKAEHPGLVAARQRVPALADLFRDASPYVPTLTIEDDEWRADLGGTLARVWHPGPGHTPGDLVVSLEDESVTVCGDLVSVGYHVNYEDAALERLEGGLGKLRGLGTRTYVPGHGAVGGREVVDGVLDYHRAVADASSSPEGARVLAARYPGFGLEEILPQSIAFWRKGKNA